MLRRRVLWSLAAAAIAAGCGSSPTSPTPAPQPTGNSNPAPQPAPAPVLGLTRVLAFGDSMTEGTVSPSTALAALSAGLPQSYPFKLQTLLTARYSAQSIVVMNAGIAGKRATDDRARFNTALSDARPELVLLMEGANDLNAGISVSTTVNAMEDMVRDATGRGARVMVATIPSQRPGGPKALAPDSVRPYDDALKVMAGRKGAELVDVQAQLPMTLIGQDGLHPTEAGYQRIAEIFLQAIASRYDTAAAARLR